MKISQPANRLGVSHPILIKILCLEAGEEPSCFSESKGPLSSIIELKPTLFDGSTQCMDHLIAPSL